MSIMDLEEGAVRLIVSVCDVPCGWGVHDGFNNRVIVFVVVLYVELTVRTDLPVRGSSNSIGVSSIA